MYVIHRALWTSQHINTSYRPLVNSSSFSNLSTCQPRVTQNFWHFLFRYSWSFLQEESVSCSFSPSMDICALTFTQPICVTHSSHPLMHFLHSPRTLVKGCFRPQRQLGLRSTLVNFQLYILMGTSGILIQARRIDDWFYRVCMTLNLLDPIGF